MSVREEVWSAVANVPVSVPFASLTVRVRDFVCAVADGSEEVEGKLYTVSRKRARRMESWRSVFSRWALRRLVREVRWVEEVGGMVCRELRRVVWRWGWIW